MSKKQYTVASCFCGLGGLDLGFELEGFNVEWANDISENAVKSYGINFGREALCGNINHIHPDEIPNTDVIIGGPPCQSFSLVGKRSAGDPRGQLVFRYVDLILAKRPKAFVLENVPGMASSKVGNRRLPEVLSDAFTSEGYRVSLMKLNSVDFLVPQRRKRLFLVGCLKGPVRHPHPQSFAEEVYGISQSSFDVSARAAINDLGKCVPKGEKAKYSCKPHSMFASLMRSQSNRTVSLHECPRMSKTDKEFVQHIPPGGNYMDIPDSISTPRVMKFKKSGGRTTTYGRLHPDEPSYTINTYFRRPNVGCNFHYRESRLITPREAMRLQAFPDHFDICFNSQDERNAFIGNAVPSLLARAIAWTVRGAMDRVADKQKMLFDSDNTGRSAASR